jgi:hypothetical protein
MARYIARFMKNVLGENGHESEICQRSVEIEASNRGTQLAKIKFCESEKVKNWVLHADRVSCYGSRVSILEIRTVGKRTQMRASSSAAICSLRMFLEIQQCLNFA